MPTLALQDAHEQAHHRLVLRAPREHPKGRLLGLRQPPQVVCRVRPQALRVQVRSGPGSAGGEGRDETQDRGIPALRVEALGEIEALLWSHGRGETPTAVALFLDAHSRAASAAVRGRGDQWTATDADQLCLCGPTHLLFGGTLHVAVAVLPAASVAVSRASPLSMIFQLTAPSPGTADGAAPRAWVSLIVVPGA